MDWIFEHIWVLIAVASVIGRLVMKRREGDATPGDQPAPPKEYEFEDPELAERTRRIREDIQRKIAERRHQTHPPSELPPTLTRSAHVERSPEATVPPVITLPEIIREVLRPQPPPVAQSSRRLENINLAEEAERQAALAEKLREAGLMKAAAQRRLVFEASTADKEPAALLKARAGVLDDLRDPNAVRRAFVLREVLGPPVALR